MGGRIIITTSAGRVIYDGEGEAGKWDQLIPSKDRNIKTYFVSLIGHIPNGIAINNIKVKREEGNYSISNGDFMCFSSSQLEQLLAFSRGA